MPTEVSWLRKNQYAVTQRHLRLNALHNITQTDDWMTGRPDDQEKNLVIVSSGTLVIDG
jgi:hypothetical protein